MPFMVTIYEVPIFTYPVGSTHFLKFVSRIEVLKMSLGAQHLKLMKSDAISFVRSNIRKDGAHLLLLQSFDAEKQLNSFKP